MVPPKWPGGLTPGLLVGGLLAVVALLAVGLSLVLTTL